MVRQHGKGGLALVRGCPRASGRGVGNVWKLSSEGEVPWRPSGTAEGFCPSKVQSPLPCGFRTSNPKELGL